MAEADRDVFQGIGLGAAEAAQYLRVTRQAVAAGLAADQQYISGDRALLLNAGLEDADADRARHFRQMLIERTLVDPRTFDEVFVIVRRDPVLEQGRAAIRAKELWIFTTEPREMSDLQYRLRMKDLFQSTEDAPLRSIAYFVAPDQAPAMSVLIQGLLSEIPKPAVRIQIVATPAAAVSPHFVIADPRSITPTGLVMVNSPDFLARMPPARTAAILTYLRKAGVGLDLDRVLSPHAVTQADGLPSFKLCYDSGDPNSPER